MPHPSAVRLPVMVRTPPLSGTPSRFRKQDPRPKDSEAAPAREDCPGSSLQVGQDAPGSTILVWADKTWAGVRAECKVGGIAGAGGKAGDDREPVNWLQRNVLQGVGGPAVSVFPISRRKRGSRPRRPPAECAARLRRAPARPSCPRRKETEARSPHARTSHQEGKGAGGTFSGDDWIAMQDV